MSVSHDNPFFLQDASFRGFVPLGVAAVGSASVAAYNEQVHVHATLHHAWLDASAACCMPAVCSHRCACAPPEGVCNDARTVAVCRTQRCSPPSLMRTWSPPARRRCCRSRRRPPAEVPDVPVSCHSHRNVPCLAAGTLLHDVTRL